MVKTSALANPSKPLQAILCSLVAFTLSAAFWIFFCPPLIICHLLPSTIFTYRIRRIAHNLVGDMIGIYLHSFITLLQLFCGVQFLEYGDIPSIQKQENALILMNHPTLFDWLYVWGYMSKFSNLNRFKVILKSDMQFIPSLGWVMSLACYLFLARDFAQDKDTILNLFDYYNKYAEHYGILVFPEGTNIGSHSIPKGEQFLVNNNMKPLQELLPPRSTGFLYLFLNTTNLASYFNFDFIFKQYHTTETTYTDDEKRKLIDQEELLSLENIQQYVSLFSDIDAIYDMTISYSPTRRSEQMNLPTGNVPLQCHVHLTRHAIVDLVEDVYNIDLQTTPQYFLENKHNPYHADHPTGQENYDRLTKDVLKFEELWGEKLKVWLFNIWYKKDQKLQQFYNKLEQYYGAPGSSNGVDDKNTEKQDGNDEEQEKDATETTTLLPDDQSILTEPMSPITPITTPPPSAASTPTQTELPAYNPPNNGSIKTSHKPHPTILLDEEYFLDVHVLSYYNAIHLALCTIILFYTFVYGPATSWLLLGWQLGVILVSTVLFTILKFPLFKLILKQTRKYERTVLSHKDATTDEIGYFIYHQRNTKNTLHDMKATLLRQSNENLSIDTAVYAEKRKNLLSFTPRQVRQIECKHYRELENEARLVKQWHEEHGSTVTATTLTPAEQENGGGEGAMELGSHTPSPHHFVEGEPLQASPETGTATLSQDKQLSAIAKSIPPPIHDASLWANSPYALTAGHYYIVAMLGVYFLTTYL